jgi:parvulin-like peptidyl-prolyl isomerase
LSLTLLLSLLLAAAPAEGAPVATVDGVSISARELQGRLEARRQRGEKVGAEEVARSLIDEVLLAAEAERRKLPLPPALAAQVEEARRRTAGRLYADSALEGVTPDEETLRGVFRLNADTVRFRLLVLTTQAAGEAALVRLRKGGTFMQEAKNSLHQESARSGGDMGLRSRGALPAPLAKVVFEAPLDEIVGPVALDLGFAVVQVTARTLGTEAEFQQKREKLVGFARQQLRGATRKHLVDQLRARDKVKLDEPFLLSTGSSSDLAQGDRLVATVAGRPLRYRDVIAYINEVFQGRPQGHAFGASVKVEMANTMIDDQLLEAEAVRTGADKLPAVEAEVAPLRREALAAALSQALLDGVPAPTEKELAAWHQAHQREYRVAAARRCRAIVVQTTADAAAVRRRLEAGEAFPAVARATSLDAASAAQGGELGDVSFDTLAAMERDPNQAPLAVAFRAAPPGELFGPVAAGGAQYLLRCDAPRPERLRPLDEVRAEVLSRARGEAGQRALDAALARLRAAAKVSVDREAVLRAAPSPH